MEIDIALVIAIISILIAMGSFFLNHLRPSKIGITVGPALEIYHSKFDHGICTGFYVPITFENVSQSNGVVTNVAMICTHTKKPAENFFMVWRELADKRHEEFSMVHPLPVQGRSSTAKIVWFCWFADSEPKLFFEEGIYELEFLYKTSVRGEAISYRCPIHMTKDHVEALEQRREIGDSLARVLYIGDETTYNRLLDPSGVSSQRKSL